MGYFINTLHTRRLDPRWEQLTKDLKYQHITGLKEETITVPAGFITDYASAPWGLQNAFNRKGKMGLAGVVHDFQYFTEHGTRKQADRLFQQICREQGMGRIRSHMAYIGVRIGAGWAWGAKDMTMSINGVWHTKRGKHFMPMIKEDFK